MLVRSLILLALVSAACGPEEKEPPAAPPPVTLGDIHYCYFISSGGIAWQHKIYKYSDGSTFASCETEDGFYTTSNVSLHKAGAPGAVTGYCQLTNDWDSSPTNGYWEFKFNGTTSTATYSDPSSPANGLFANLSCTKF